MANQPRSGQTFVGFKCDQHLLALVERARGRTDRSLWLRQAVAEKLRAIGFNVPDDLIYPPDRARVNASDLSMVAEGSAAYSADTKALVEGQKKASYSKVLKKKPKP